MKILKLVILITFLFNSAAYPSDNLRVPMIGDKANKDRLESAGTLTSGHNVGATDQKKRFSLQDYRPGWTFTGWGAAKRAIKQKFTSTKERKEALQLVRTFLVKEVTKSRNTYPLRDAILEYTLNDAIPAVIYRAKNPNELEELFTIAIDTVKNFYPVYRAALDECRRLHGDNFETWGTDLEFSIYEARDVKRCYGNYIMRYSYDKPRFAYSPVFVNQPYWRIKFRCNISPLTNLSNLKLTPVLFLDTEIAPNSFGFEFALANLKTNEGNIPVVLLTKETKDSIQAKLKGLDLKEVQFRTPAELGLQDLQWDKDERVSDIDGQNGLRLRCIPLTQLLCEKFKDLQKARDQV